MNNLMLAKVGMFYIIEGIMDKAPLKIKRRILELGFTRGQRVRLLRKSLLGKAYLVELRGFTLTIRKDIAGLIILR